MKKLIDMKFRVNSPEHSEEIQRELFRLGYKWPKSLKEVTHTQMIFLYANTDGTIGWSNSDVTPIQVETTLEELKLM